MDIALDVEKPLVLIVDDMPRNLQVLGSILMEEDFEIAVATNGVEAVKVALEILPDLILLDVMMPEMDGFTACRKLKEIPATQDIPIIFITARVEVSDIVKGFESGGMDYITKPFKKQELMVRINTHLKLSLARRKLEQMNAELSVSQEEIRQLERKNSVMAMAVTANHEINQPLMILQGTFDLFEMEAKHENLPNIQVQRLEIMRDAIERIRTTLDKYKDAQNFKLETYSNLRDMVKFEE